MELNTERLNFWISQGAQMTDKVANIGSMTPKERRNPHLLNGSRRARVAKGSGTQPSDVNKLLKQFQQMEKMMGKLAGGGMPFR